jgi:hypothetical protein
VEWFFHVKIYIERLPLHAWSAAGVKQLLGDVCTFDHMEAATFRQENTDMFCFFGWMPNPDLLPRSKLVTFFPERTGRSSMSDGPPLAEAHLATPPRGWGDVEVLIHLDQYYDWTPQSDSSPSTEISGLQASSVSSSDASFPVFWSFAWALESLMAAPCSGRQGPAYLMSAAGSRIGTVVMKTLMVTPTGVAAATGGATSMHGGALPMISRARQV